MVESKQYGLGSVADSEFGYRGYIQKKVEYESKNFGIHTYYLYFLTRVGGSIPNMLPWIRAWLG